MIPVKIILMTAILFFNSCAYFNKVSNRTPKKVKTERGPKGLFVLSDKSGEFVLERESGFNKSDGTQVVKRLVYSKGDQERKELEKSVAISRYGKLKDKLPVLKPEVSQFTVWFESQKYFTEMRLDEKEKALRVKVVSPEPQWNKTELVPLPKGTGVYCFFSQLVECVKATGFFELAVEKDAGQMSFHVIWDGYPFFQEQYLDIPNEVISPVQLNYDGKNGSSERRFSFMFRNNVIFYLLEDDFEFYKMFWVSQGMSVSPNGVVLDEMDE
jgi:hypothetical protein